MNDLVQMHRDFDVCESLAFFVEKPQIGDEAERIGHCHDALCQSNPIPGDPGRLRLSFVAPEGLTRTKAQIVAKVQHRGAEMCEMQLRCAAGLPQ